MINNIGEINPIAIGTYGLGAERFEVWNEGKNEKYKDYDKHMEALEYSFSIGQNLIECSYIYAGGQTMKFLGDFFKRIDRDKMFIKTKLENFIGKKEDVEIQLDKYLKIMGLDYTDTLLLHTSKTTRLSLEETHYEMNKMIQKGKVRNLSASNLNIDQLKSLKKDGFKFFSYEGLYNLECKANEDVGIIDFCKENKIAFICYQPLRRLRTSQRNYELLVELSRKYNVTQNQILINWIIKEKGLIPIVKSGSIKHVKENMESLNFKINKNDIDKLNEFRSQEFDSINIDWDDSGKGVPIYKYANQFD